MKTKSKVAILIVIVLGVVVTILGLSLSNNKEQFQMAEHYEQLTDYENVFDKIKLSEVEEMINTTEEGEYFIVYFGIPTCSYCQRDVPVINRVAKEQGIETIYYVKFDFNSELSQTWRETKKYNYKGTPLVAVFDENGYVKSNSDIDWTGKSRLNGYTELFSDVKQRINDYEQKQMVKDYEELTDNEHVFDKIKLSEVEEIISTTEEGEYFIVYFGIPSCFYCQEAVPVINRVAKEQGIETIYYVKFDYDSELAQTWKDTKKYNYTGTPSVAIFDKNGYVKNNSAIDDRENKSNLQLYTELFSEYK